MIVDGHCHLDFPTFASGSRRGSWIARVRRAWAAWSRFRRACAEYAEAAGDRRALRRCVLLGSAPHPHNAHEELDIGTADLVAKTASSQGASPSAKPVSTITTTPARAMRRSEASARTSRRRARPGLPLVIHSREADDDMAQILEEEMGKGAFPAVPALLHRRPRAGDRARSQLGLRFPSPAS